MSSIEIQGQKFEVFQSWETVRGIRQRAYTLVGPRGQVFVTERGAFHGNNHLLRLVDKKTKQALRGVDCVLTDARGSLEIAKTGLPTTQG